MQYLTMVPAYGRDYKSKAQVKKDWDETKDFQLTTPRYSGRYINKCQLPEDARAEIRYTGLKKVVVL